MGNCLSHKDHQLDVAEHLGHSIPSHEQLAAETHCKICRKFDSSLLCFSEAPLFAVSVDEVYALEELFKNLSNSIHRVQQHLGF